MIARLRQWLDRPSVSPVMIKTFVITVAALAVVIPLGLIALPYIEFFNDMAVQQKVKPQMVWKEEAAGPVPGDFPPVAGTLPREFYEYPFPYASRPPLGVENPDARARRIAAIEEHGELAARLLEEAGPDIPPPYIPPRPTRESMQRGQKLFNNLCIACHGQYGLGDGRVPPRGLPPPPSLLERREREFSDARIFHIITNGQNVMPSYAWQLPPADRWAVVHYVRALQRAFPEPPPTAAETAGAAPAGPAEGKAGGSAR